VSVFEFFPAPGVMAVIIWLEAIRIMQVWLQHLREVLGVTELRLSVSVL
jgi:hypothetical protein